MPGRGAVGRGAMAGAGLQLTHSGGRRIGAVAFTFVLQHLGTHEEL